MPFKFNFFKKQRAEFKDTVYSVYQPIVDIATGDVIGYEALARRVLQGGTDEEMLEWCFQAGRQPTPEETDVWNAFMMKRGWRDDGTEGLEAAKREAGLGHRADIQTYFDFQDADEGRDKAIKVS